MAENKTSEQKGKGKNGAEAPSKFLTADRVLAAQDIREDELHIEEWGGSVIVKGLTSRAHEKLVASCMEGPPQARQFNFIGYQAKLVVACAYNDKGERIFSDEHVPLLMEKASGPVGRIATKAQELSGIGAEALNKIKENLGQTTSAASASA